MKNEKIFKKLAIVMLSLMFILVSANCVLAVDDDDLLFTNIVQTEDTDGDTPTQNTQPTNNTNANTNGNNNTNISSLTTNNTNNASNTNTNANTSRNVSNTNELAKTGLSNTGSIISLILVICGISAIYSYKKVNDYKKL